MGIARKGREKGRPKIGGRVKGTPNKITADLREAILHAFEAVGGEAYLAMVAKKHPPVFCMLLAKILPLQVTGKDGQPIETVDVSAREFVLRRLAQLAERELIAGPIDRTTNGEPEECASKPLIQ